MRRAMILGAALALVGPAAASRADLVAQPGLVGVAFTGVDVGSPGGPLSVLLAYRADTPLTSSAGGVNRYGWVGGNDVRGSNGAGLAFSSTVEITIAPSGGGYRLTATETPGRLGGLVLTVDGLTSPLLPASSAGFAGFTGGAITEGAVSLAPIGNGVLTSERNATAPEPSTIAGAGVAVLAGIGYGFSRRRAG